MRIAVVSAMVFDDSMGGVENHIRFIAKHLTERGHEVLVFKPSATDSSVEEKVVDGIAIRPVVLARRVPYLRGENRAGVIFGLATVFLRRVALSLGSREVCAAVTQWAPDVVWQHDLSASWLATRRLSELYPVVLTNHTGEYLFLTRAPFSTVLLRRILDHYTAVIGPSAELTPSFHDNARMIPNGVETKFFGPPATRDERDALRWERLGVRDEFVVLCPRRWAPTKGVLYLARAMRLLASRGGSAAGFVFVFAGSAYDRYPSYVRRVEAALRTSKCRVVKLGNVDIYRLREYYQLADLVVIPSLMEATSLAALEAMACGTPVLATSVGGMPSLISHGNTGYLVPARSADALASELVRIRGSADLNKVAGNALRIVRLKYDWDVVAAEVEHVLTAAIASHTWEGGHR